MSHPAPLPAAGDELPEALLVELERSLKTHLDEAVAIRRDLHAHPELGHDEVRTTRLVRDRLVGAGLAPRVLASGTGLLCDVGEGAQTVALRADIDALPVQDETRRPYRSAVPGVAHACGHDVHTAVVTCAGLMLADLHAAGLLPGRVRLVFQPAEELMPGGSHDVMASGGLDGVSRIFCVHCDPRLTTGQVGMRVGPITSACDLVSVVLTGPGGHTARPHLSADLAHALGTLVSELPAALSRRLDPRAGVSLVWGRMHAGQAANTIPSRGEAAGTLRCLDARAWLEAPGLVDALAREIVAPYGVTADVQCERGVPPLVNDETSTALLRAATEAVLGSDAVADTEQSLGAEDFAWYLDHVPGALARLGVRRPGRPDMPDLHRGGFDPDEDAITVGARLLTATALLTLRQGHSLVTDR